MQLVDLQAAAESEKIVLSAILMNNEVLYMVGGLRAEHFSTEYHRLMFAALVDMITAGTNVDHYVLHSRFVAERKTGLAEYITVFDDGILSARIDAHLPQVLRAAQRRSIIQTLRAALAQAEDFSEENQDVLAVTQERLLELTMIGHESKALKVDEFSEATYQKIRTIRERGVELVGLTYGLPDLDRKTTGIRPGEYVIVGAVPGDGKTAFGIQMIVENAKTGVPTLMFSQEMSRDAVLLRAIPNITEGKVSAKKLRSPIDMFGDEVRAFEESKAVVDGWPLWVNDASSMKITDLVSNAYMMIQRHGIKLIVVDYLQLLKADGDNRYEQVSRASAGLRELAKAQKVAVVAISQLGRPEGRQKARPTMFSLKESGDLEAHAHVVLLLYRPLNKQGYFSCEDLVIIGKQREGPTGGIPVVFSQDRLMYLPRLPKSGIDESQQSSGQNWYEREEGH